MPNGENNKYIIEISKALARAETRISTLLERLASIEKKMMSYDEKLLELENRVSKNEIMITSNGGLKGKINTIDKEVDMIQDKMDSLTLLKGKMSVIMIIITAIISATTSLLIYFLTHSH